MPFYDYNTHYMYNYDKCISSLFISCKKFVACNYGETNVKSWIVLSCNICTLPAWHIWIMLQPYFWKSGRMTFTLPKWGLGSLPRLPKLHSLIAGVKTPCIECYLYHWKTIEVQMSKMGSPEPFGLLQHKLWQKEKPGVKLAFWLLTTKIQ
jgi:hypothetical protein